MDRLYEGLFLGGLALAAAGWVWLMIAAFRARPAWGLAVLLIPPAAIGFMIRHWPRAKAPTGVLLAGLLMAGTPAIYTRVAPVDLGPRRTIVDGAVHVTLTGWDQSDYSVLRQFPDVSVLQMANADVTNDTLTLLTDCERLTELDVSDSQVSDAGLAAIARLPALEVLRLRNCRITDDGFREHLLPHATLRRLDLTGTAVTTEVIREWRKVNPDRRAMQ